MRVVASVGCAAYALLAVASGLDRAAAHWAALGRQVPAPLAAKALEATALDAMLAANWRAALTDAGHYVDHAPVEPMAPALLGTARLELGDAAGAEAAFRVAGQMGWRVPLTQRYWMERALALGDYAVAAQRLDAMLRQQPALMADRALMRPLEQSGEGRAALAGRLVARPDWLEFYLKDVATVPVDVMRLRALVLDEAARAGLVAGCEGAAVSAQRLVELGEARVAAGLWHAHCRSAGRGLLADGNFAQASFQDTVTPFDWQFASASDVDVTLEPAAGGGRQARVTTSAPYTRLVVSQFAVVPAGSYRLSWRSEGHSGRETPEMMASLDCDAHSTRWLEAVPDARPGWWSARVELDDACQGKWLAFSVRPGVAEGAGVRGGTVTLGAVMLERVAAP